MLDDLVDRVQLCGGEREEIMVDLVNVIGVDCVQIVLEIGGEHKMRQIVDFVYI